MKQKNNLAVVLCACTAALAAGASGKIHAAENAETERQLRELQQQNQALQEQLRQQQKLIESLSKKVDEIQEADAQRTRQLQGLQDEMKDSGPTAKRSTAFSLGKVNLSAEGGIAFFNSGSEGAFPNAEFRVDEAKLFVEAPVLDNVYFFGELNLMTRESLDLNVQLGELYLDVENVSKLWNRDRMLNLRLGRMYTPFGEEYLSRYAIDNPLVSHSLSDVWGVDEGLELYGNLGKFSYAVAVQNGGPSGVRDFTADKSIAGRLSFDPNSWLHVSASGMRTGDLQPPGDSWSELWFGNGWFIPIGSRQTTKFHANLFEGDVEFRLPHGHINAFGGYARYSDNDPTADNGRDIWYYAVEGVQDLTHKLYAAARFSQILVDKGYPLAGNGAMGDYFFSSELTKELWRLSLGLGYRWSQNLVTKAEYSFERGKEVNGESRTHEDLFAVEAAFRF